jgi:demethylmenaquinone methyltransferase / 2-methoxy-6-polyprenyl-1,4-benzoquinol methylase
MFDAISPTYDFLNHLLSLNCDVRWRRFAAAKLMCSSIRSVLDVCAGTGDLALALQRRAHETDTAPSIHAADFSPAMIALAQNKFRAATPRPCPEPLIADTLHLPFKPDSFDLVTVAFGIRNVCDLAAGLGEMVRVCRDGGRVAVLEFSTVSNPLLRGLFNLYFLRILPAVGRLISGTRAYTYLPKSVQQFPAHGEFVAMLERAAGGRVERFPLSFGIAALYVADVRKSQAADKDKAQ